MYKNILIISAFNLSGNSATDITLRSIFKYWPNENLIILTTTKNNEEFAQTICLKSSYLTKIRLFFHKILVGEKSYSRNIVPGVIIKQKRSIIKYKEILFSIGASYFDLTSLKINHKTKQKITDFDPQVIYCTLGNIRITKLALMLSKKYGAPLIPHFMDDWISTIYTGSIFLIIPRIIMKMEFSRMIQNITLGFCISAKMCSEYKKRYKKEFSPLMNIVSAENIYSPLYKFQSMNTPITFSYFGGLHLNRWKTIKVFAEVLEEISAETRRNLKIIVFSSSSDYDKYNELLNYHSIKFKSAIPHEKVFFYMQESDYLVHVESFDDNVSTYTKFSISTKIPEYIASGKPIVAIGPNGIASMEYLSENKAAYTINELNKQILKKSIDEIIINNYPLEYLLNANRLAVSNHSKDSLVVFENIINSLEFNK